jgi:hypothetical protein
MGAQSTTLRLRLGAVTHLGLVARVKAAGRHDDACRRSTGSAAERGESIEMSHGHGHGLVEGENKKIAIIISILALFLAIAETLGKSAQTDGISYNVEASNMWAFFQAKTIRKTTMETAAEQMEVDLKLAKDPATQDLLKKRIEGWQSRAARYESEPKPDGKGEGRKELMARAIAAENKRDLALAKYHNFEYGSAAFQIAIVLASSYLITGVAYLLWGALGVGGIGVFFVVMAIAVPNFHLFGH